MSGTHRTTISRSVAAAFATRGVTLIGVALLLAACGERRKSAPATASAASESSSAPATSGEEIYEMYCSVCHMSDGGGVPNFQPALRGSAIVAGDPAKLEAVIRAGSAALQNRESAYAAEMPPFGSLSDEEIRATVAYVRARFGAADAGKAP